MESILKANFMNTIRQCPCPLLLAQYLIIIATELQLYERCAARLPHGGIGDGGYPARWAPCTKSQRLPQVHGGTPVFAIEDGPPPPASPSFTCHLTIPALSIPHGGYEETSFTAVARSKKAAEHAAAEKALGFIAAQGLLPQPTPAPVPVQGLNVSVDEARSASLSCVCIGLMLQASDTRNANAEALHDRFGAIARERDHRDTLIGLLPGKGRTAPPLHGLASAGLSCWP